MRLPLIESRRFDGLLDAGDRLLDIWRGFQHCGEFVGCEIVADGVGNDEVAVGEPLHQRAGAEAVGAVVGEVGFAEDEQAGDGALQVVIDPEAAHGVVDGGIDAHGNLVGVLVGDALVHVKEIAVALADGLLAQAPDGVGRSRDRRRGRSRRRR